MPTATLYLRPVGNKLLSNKDNIEGAGCSTCSSYLTVTIHSPWKAWCCRVKPYNVLECRTLIPLTVRAEGMKINSSFPILFQTTVNTSGHGYLT